MLSSLRNLCRHQAAVLAGRESCVEQWRAHAFAVQTDDLAIELAEHAFDLMVEALMQGQAGMVRSGQFELDG